MKLTDYIAEFLDMKGVETVFGITGGYIVHLFDSLSKRGIEYICPNNEQGASIAADGYSRVSGKIGVAISTSGPGAANLINGVLCAHFDSIPMLVITGQCPTSAIRKNKNTRQRGFQEMRVTDIYEPFTKYSTIIMDADDIAYELEKAYYIALDGRPGAVVIDLPDDIQRAEIEPNDIKHFIEPPKQIGQIKEHDSFLIENLIRNAKKPLFILGAGIRISTFKDAYWEVDRVRKVINNLGIPFVTTWGGTDLFPFNHNLNIGNFGTIGTKYGNTAIQEADVIISIGSRLDDHSTTTKVEMFGKNARKVIIDIDRDELQKLRDANMKNAMFLNTSIRNFLDMIETYDINMDHTKWVKHLNDLKDKYPICKSEYKEQKDYVNPYVFLDMLSELSSDKDIVITDAGADLAYTMQGYQVKGNQRLWSDFNNSTMGYSMACSVGACIANNKKRIICIIGDGGIQMNLQELATIKKHNLPIKVFIFNNKGYGMMKQTQDDWLGSRYIAATNDTGLSIPDTLAIAKAIGIKTANLRDHDDLPKIKDILDSNECVVCDVNISADQRITPKMVVGKTLDEIE